MTPEASIQKPETDLPVAYLTTHYPRVALTFVAGEIDGVEQCGLTVHPIAMNRPSASDLLTQSDRARHAQTLYLKDSPARIATALLSQSLRHPIRMMRLVATAIKAADLDLKQAVRHLVHLAYAARVAAYCDAAGIRHLHAVFATAPGTIAWFAAAIMNFDPRRRAGWSFTVHGPHDFFDQSKVRIDLKAASARFIACISDFSRSQVYRIIDPADWPKVEVVRCGIDLAALPRRAARASSSPARIVTLGRIAPEKGHLILLQAIGLLADRGIAAELDIVGAGPFEAAVRAEAERLGLTGHTHFTGELLPAAVAEALGQADIFCMASFAEGLPISIMEAMALGVPVVCTAISGIPELAIDGETALTVPPGNAVALADALDMLISDPQLGERLTHAARSAVEAMHDRSANAAGLAKLFRRSAGGIAVAHPADVSVAALG